MIKHKIFFFLGLTLCVVIVTLAIGNWGKPNRAVGGIKPRVMVSLPLLKDLVTEIAGDSVSVKSVIQGASCNHDYEPSSGDLRQVAESALFIKAGLGFDVWADRLASTVSRDKVIIIDASQGVTAIQDAMEHHHDDTHDQTSEKHHHEAGNPHYWGNPANVKRMAKNILVALQKIEPGQKRKFEANYHLYLSRLDQVTRKLQTKVFRLKDKRIVSYSAAFPYLYQYFGFTNRATVETTCEQEVTPKRLMQTVELIRNQHVKVIVGEETFPELPENLVKETGAKLVLLWPGTNSSGKYLNTLSENVEKLVAALQ